jgi:hypothetical protein
MKMPSPKRDDKCREVFAMLSDYLNMELPPETCRELEAHLDSCELCQELTASFRGTMELCRGYRPSELSESLARDVREQILNSYLKVLEARRIAEEQDPPATHAANSKS